MRPGRLVIPFVLAPALLVAACNVERSQPAPVTDADNWGHLSQGPDEPPPPEKMAAARG